ncbi:transposase [Rhodococcus sp. KBS0724]|uniref:transposase n=1 Tax=Rhodococcus sp. KBS0724 TaxID=1179674 RepID=UPI00110EA52E|nr:transposase [Rhodococcus sp. KBS0724]TSD39677.1 transposase [Rhodococcus sp. KBS0724]
MAAGSKRYSAELKKDAVDMVAQGSTEWAAMGKTADLLGVRSAKTVRLWVRKVPAAGPADSVASAESELVRKLKRANGILKAASAFLRPKSTGHTDNRGLRRHPPGQPGGC